MYIYAHTHAYRENDRWGNIGHGFYVGKDLVSQSLSAFCTSSLENVSTVGSSHSLSEAVLLFSLTLFGLVSSEHIGTSLNFTIGSVSGQ